MSFQMFSATCHSYRSDRQEVHKGALIRMLKALSGDLDIEDIEEQLNTLNIREEDEITVCELFEQYERKGRNEGLLEGISQGRSEGISQGRSEGLLQGRSEGLSQGIKVLIQTCREIRLSFTETAERVKNGFQLDDAELEKNMQLYWPK